MDLRFSKKCLFGGTILAGGLAAPALGNTLLFNIDVDPAGWDAAIAGKVICPDPTDFTLDPDYGLTGFNASPLTSAGAGPVGAGTVADWMSITTFGYYGSFNGNMVGIGASYGVYFGNTWNAVGANYFVDSTIMDFEPGKCAVKFNAASIFGSYTIDITVYDGAGNVTTFYATPAFWTNFGIMDPDNISRIVLTDPVGGGELIQCDVNAWQVPAPGVAPVLGLAGLAAVRRRRR